MNQRMNNALLFGISQEVFQRIAFGAAGLLLSAAVRCLGNIASDLTEMKTQLAVVVSTIDSESKRISLLETEVFGRRSQP
jgi:hypothetical protein